MSTTWKTVFRRLDTASRKRALTEPESLLLERAIGRLDWAEDRRARRAQA